MDANNPLFNDGWQTDSNCYRLHSGLIKKRCRLRHHWHYYVLKLQQQQMIKGMGILIIISHDGDGISAKVCQWNVSQTASQLAPFACVFGTNKKQGPCQRIDASPDILLRPFVHQSAVLAGGTNHHCITAEHHRGHKIILKKAGSLMEVFGFRWRTNWDSKCTHIYITSHS